MAFNQDNYVSMYTIWELDDELTDFEQLNLLLEKCISKTTENEADTCVCYGFSYDENNEHLFCNDTYVNARGVGLHMQNVSDFMSNFADFGADMKSISFTGRKSELEKIKTMFEAMPGLLSIMKFNVLVGDSARNTKNI